jgi:putative oxidoreductase
MPRDPFPDRARPFQRAEQGPDSSHIPNKTTRTLVLRCDRPKNNHRLWEGDRQGNAAAAAISQGVTMEAQRRDLLGSLGLLILRAGFGGYMMMHGWGKLQMMIDGDFEKFADPIGLGSSLSLVLITMAEFFCAFLVLVGFATRVTAAPIVVAMAVAAFVVHRDDPWMMGAAVSKQPALMFMTAFLALMFTGGGRFSVDGQVWRRGKKKPE